MIMSMAISKTKMGIYKTSFHLCPQNSCHLIRQVFHEIWFEIPELVCFILKEMTTGAWRRAAQGHAASIERQNWS